MKLVQTVTDAGTAKLLADPMRRAILNILRRGALTQAQLAESLGLTNATVSHHLNLLKKAGLLSVVKEEIEEHGIVKKFYTPSAYLYLIDTNKLPREAARYYYPINIERARGIYSALPAPTTSSIAGKDIDAAGEEFVQMIVKVAHGYANVKVDEDRGEELVRKMYREALARISTLTKLDSE